MATTITLPTFLYSLRNTLLLSPLLLTPALAQTLTPLPEPVSNNPVLTTTIRGKTYIASFAGLGEGKTAADAHNKAWMLISGDSSWQKLPNVPSSLGHSSRLAMTAAVLEQNFYLFGGYSVAQDGTEVTQPDSYRFSVISKNYTKLPDMPVAVDDSVALAYQNRYIYLVSGWHNDGNINLVQVFDNFTQKWSQATPFPGTPVFGHAAAIEGNVMVVCDGVSTALNPAGERSYVASPACYRGEINSSNVRKISWKAISHPTGTARYRQAALPVTIEGERYLAFIAGSSTPYNFDGVGYNGKPAEPDDKVWLYQLSSQKWRLGKTDAAVMDLRNFIEIDGGIYSLGGMGAGQQVKSDFRKQQITLLPD